MAKKSEMAQLYLSQMADRQEHAEVELFLEGYHDDLHSLQLKVAALFEQVMKIKKLNYFFKLKPLNDKNFICKFNSENGKMKIWAQYYK